MQPLIEGIDSTVTNLLVSSAPAVPLKIDASPFIPQIVTDEQFHEFCQKNPDLRIERTAKGEVIVMPPAFSDTGNRNFRIALAVGKWAEKDGTGECFDSSAGFTLPNGATRSPDISWIALDRWNALSDSEQSSFAPICPDFVIELRSSSDTLRSLQDKMEEYIENGTRLGLLIDRKNRTVHIYRPSRATEVLENPTSVDCNPELPGFTLQTHRIW